MLLAKMIATYTLNQLTRTHRNRIEEMSSVLAPLDSISQDQLNRRRDSFIRLDASSTFPGLDERLRNTD